MKIPITELKDKNIFTDFMEKDPVGIYRTYLIVTDYICNKIVEGVSTKEDYAKELKYRQIAREEIKKLSQ